MVMIEVNKDIICAVIGEDKWQEYKDKFGIVDEKYITKTQHNRLIENCPEDDEDLRAHGITKL